MKKSSLLCILLCLLISICTLVQADSVSNGYFLNLDYVDLAVGKTDQLKITYENAEKAFRNAGFVFTSSNSDIAKVNSSGKITAVAAGECTIRATSKYDETIFTDIPVSVYLPTKKISAKTDKDAIYCGETSQISWSLIPENATYRNVYFSSSKDSVATVDDDGIITGRSKGSAVITITSEDGHSKATVKITVRQQPKEVAVTPAETNCVVGKTISLKSTVLPKNADNHKVNWVSSDESIATVSTSGAVKALKLGDVEIRAISQADSSIVGKAIVHCVQKAKSIIFERKITTVTLYDSIQLKPTVLPEDTSDPSVTFTSANPKVCVVDANGVVTAVGSGKTVITAKTADGSNRSARITVQVLTPVTGVSFKKDGVRLGVNSHTTVAVDIQPSQASNKNMTWYSSDESIATVSGNTNKVRISGRQWGRCTITGITADGDYTVTFHANVGSLRNAIKVVSVTIRNDRPYIVLKNVSNITMSSVYYEIYGLDSTGERVVMSTKPDVTVLTGRYSPLYPGELTVHGNFHYYNYLKNKQFWDLTTLYVAYTGFDTDEGYYDSNGALNYSYRINRENFKWICSE